MNKAVDLDIQLARHSSPPDRVSDGRLGGRSVTLEAHENVTTEPKKS
jgi:hypothetical protein